MIAFKILVHTSFQNTVGLAKGGGQDEEGMRVNFIPNTLMKHIRRFCVSDYVCPHICMICVITPVARFTKFSHASGLNSTFQNERD